MPWALGLGEQPLVLGVVDRLGLVDEHDRDVVLDGVAALQARVVERSPRPRSRGGGPCRRGRRGSRAAGDRGPWVRAPCGGGGCGARAERQPASMRAWTSATWPAHLAASGASRLSRSRGSVFDARRLNHQSPRSTVRPSRRSWASSGYAAGHALDDGRGIVDLRVDLARRRVAVEGPAQLGQRHAGLAELLEHHQRGDGAGVGAPVVAEVVVRRVLATEGGAGLGHHRLDEAVAHLGAHRRAAALAHDLGHRLRADAVVEDRGAGLLVEHAGRDDRRGGRARQRLRRSRRRGTPGRRRRRRRGRRRRPPRAPAPGGRAGSPAGSDRRGGSGRCRRARRRAPRGRSGRPANTAGTTRPPMPLAVSATTLSGRRAPTVDERADVVGEGAEEVERSRARRRGRRGRARRSAAIALISARPLSSPTGRAPARQSFMPLYWAGLCEAVNMAPGASSFPAAKYTRSVEASPRSTTSRPWARTPSAKAAGQLHARRAHVAPDQHLAGAADLPGHEHRRRPPRRPAPRPRRAGRGWCPGCRRP